TVTENQPCEFTVAVTPWREGKPPKFTIKPATLWSSVTWPEKVQKLPTGLLAVKLEIIGCGFGGGAPLPAKAGVCITPVWAAAMTPTQNKAVVRMPGARLRMLAW